MSNRIMYWFLPVFMGSSILAVITAVSVHFHTMQINSLQSQLDDQTHETISLQQQILQEQHERELLQHSLDRLIELWSPRSADVLSGGMGDISTGFHPPKTR